MKQKKEVIYLLFGGESPEHEISLITAQFILANYDTAKYTLYPLYLDKKNAFYHVPEFSQKTILAQFDKLKKQLIKIELKSGRVRFHGLLNPSVCILAFHGGIGEGGAIQGFLDVCDIPYTGPQMKGCVLSMDKAVTKILLEKEHIPIIRGKTYIKSEWVEKKANLMNEIRSKYSFPLIVKPTTLGSSIGVSKVETSEALEEAIDNAFLYAPIILIEDYIAHAKEVTCSVMQKDGVLVTSAIEQIKKTEDNLFSFEDKYISENKGKKRGAKTASYSFNSPNISDEIEEKIRTFAKQIYNTLQLSSLIRVDFFIDEITNEIYVIEPNGIPGFFSFYLWETVGVQKYELIDILIKNAKVTYSEKKDYLTSFSSNLWSQ